MCIKSKNYSPLVSLKRTSASPFSSDRTLLSCLGFFLCTVAASLFAKIDPPANAISARTFCAAGYDGPRGSRLWQFYYRLACSSERIFGLTGILLLAHLLESNSMALNAALTDTAAYPGSDQHVAHFGVLSVFVAEFLQTRENTEGKDAVYDHVAIVI